MNIRNKVFAILVATLLMSACSKTEQQLGSSGAPLTHARLVAESEGCKIYSVDTSNLPINNLYLTKCDQEVSSATTTYTSGKTKVEVSNITVPEIPEPPKATFH